jgi:hypothetical protein
MVNKDANDSLQMLVVEDQEPVQTLRANGPHESFRDPIGLWGPKRRAHHLYAMALEDPVKTLGELLIPIANQEAERFLALRQGPGQLPGLLCHPRPARIGCASREMHATSAELDEEEHVEALQPDRSRISLPFSAISGESVVDPSSATATEERWRAFLRGRVTAAAVSHGDAVETVIADGWHATWTRGKESTST